MLFENENLVPTEKEMRLQIFINQLVNDLFNNEKIEVNSKDLLELLSYLTSNEEISSEMKTATEYQRRNIEAILHKREVDILKERLKQLEEERNTYRKQLNDVFSRGFIHKDKIKEKNKNLEGKLKQCEEDAIISRAMFEGGINICKELLGEE